MYWIADISYRVSMRIRAEDTMALIVDVQEKLVPVMSDGAACVQRIKLLAEGLKVLGIPMVVTQQYTKGLGMTVAELRDSFEDFAFLDKISFSCYEDEKIKETIDSFGKKNIVLCGMETHICVLQTAVDLMEAGYQVIAVTNCMDSRKEEDKSVALQRCEYEKIILTTYESLLFELTERAGSDRFKSISKLIK